MVNTLKLFPALIEAQVVTPPSTAAGRRGQHWQGALAGAHGRAHATCLCLPVAQGERKLSVKRVTATGMHHLARYPFTADQHSELCLYSVHGSAPDDSEGEPAQAVAAIVRRDDGLTMIALDASLHSPVRVGQPHSRRGTPVAAPTTHRRRDRIGLMGLLATLWEAAGLNVWHPSFEGRRNTYVAMSRLLKAAQSIRVNKVPLSQILLLQTGAAAEERSGRNTAVTAAAVAAGHRLIVLSSLARYSPDKHLPEPRNLPVAGFFGMPWVALDAALWHDTLAHFPDAQAAWQANRTVVIAALIDPLSRPASALTAALMPVCDGLIPVSSLTEAAYSQRLRGEGKAFTRVLRDSPDGPVFTGFVLGASD